MTAFPVFSTAGAVVMTPARFATFLPHMRVEFLRLAREAGASEAALTIATGLRDVDLRAHLATRHAYRVASEGDSAPEPAVPAPLQPGGRGGHPPRIAIALLALVVAAPDQTLVANEQALATRLHCKPLSVRRAFERLLRDDLVVRARPGRGPGFKLTAEGSAFLAASRVRA